MRAIVILHVVQWTLLAGLVLITLALARQIGLLHRRLPPAGAREIENQGPRVGAQAPSFDSVALDGRVVGVPHPSLDTLIVFVTTTCSVCHELMPGVDTVARGEKQIGQAVIVSLDDRAKTERWAAEHEMTLPIVASRELGVLFQVGTTPYAFVIDRAGYVRSGGLVNHLEHLESLVDSAAAASRNGARSGHHELHLMDHAATDGGRVVDGGS